MKPDRFVIYSIFLTYRYHTMAVSSTKRNGILLIAISVIFAVGIILAITLTKGSKQSSKRPKRDGKFADSRQYRVCPHFLFIAVRAKQLSATVSLDESNTYQETMICTYIMLTDARELLSFFHLFKNIEAREFLYMFSSYQSFDLLWREYSLLLIVM